MAKSEMRLEGLSDLLAKLKALPAEIGSKGGGPLRLALFTATKLMRDDAQMRAPVDTGRLQRNVIAFRDRDPRSSGVTEQYGITFRRGKQGRERKSYHTSARGEKDAWYGRFVEFGTSKTPAQPFLRPAFEARKRDSAEAFRSKLAAAIAAAVVKMQRRAGRG
jgi:HK97 gp10 family phage protein